MPPRGNLAASSPKTGASVAARLAAQGRDRAVTAPKSLLGVSKDDLVNDNDADIENFGPPGWRTVLNNRVDLGYPDFYPSRPGFNQTEDVLTEDNVKNGFSARSFVAVGAESFSMHGPIHAHLQNGCLAMLNKLGNEVLHKRDESMPQFGERSFRIPPRVTYNDVKRQAFLSDLGNANIPLSRLMRQPVPHGFRGVEMLDSMYLPVPPTRPGAAQLYFKADPIPIDRAIWFIRVLGANEISAHRARITASTVTSVSALSPAASTPGAGPPTNDKSAIAPPIDSNEWYTQEFTTVFTQWMRLQLNQLLLPALAGTQSTAPAKSVGVLGDTAARSKWLAKWNYTTGMLAGLTARRLLSQFLLCGFLTDFLATANLAQTGFILRLLCDRIQELSDHTMIGKQCLTALLERIEEIQLSPAREAMEPHVTLAQSLVISLVRTKPEVAMSPLIWRYHGMTLESIVGADAQSLQMVKGRSMALLLTSSEDAMKRKAVATASKTAQLDSISATTDMAALSKSYFDGGSSASAAVIDTLQLASKVDDLLNWAIDLFQLGSHRPYAAHTLLRLWLDEHDASRSGGSKSRSAVSFDLFPMLYGWLDTSEAAQNSANAAAIGITFGEFTRQGLFSYGRYLQTLIALGHTARSRDGKDSSHHLALLQALPIFVEAKDLLHQRRLALSGDDAVQRHLDALEEDRLLAQYNERIKEYLPELFGTMSYGHSEVLRDARDFQIEGLETMSRHLFLQSRFWLIPHAQKALVRGISTSTFARCIHLFSLTRGLSTLGDFLCHAIKVNASPDILQMTLDAIQTHEDAWTAMDRWPRIISALVDRLMRLDKAEKYSAPLVNALRRYAALGLLSGDDKEELALVWGQHSKNRTAPDKPWTDAAGSMDAVIGAVASASEVNAVELAGKLFSRHGPFSLWATVWWEAVMCAVQRLSPAATLAVHTAIAHATRVHKLADDTQVDSAIRDWASKLEVSDRVGLLSSSSTTSLIQVLLGLVARRCSSATTLVTCIVEPLWAALSAGLPKRLTTSQSLALDNSLILAEQLLLDSPPSAHLPPTTNCEAQIFQASRAAVLQDPIMVNLIRQLPSLVALKLSRGMPPSIATHVDSFSRALARTIPFKVAVFRHIDLMQDSFSSTAWTKSGSAGHLAEAMVSTVKMLVAKEAPPPTPLSTFAYSPIELKHERRTSHSDGALLDMQMDLKRLGTAVGQGEAVPPALAELRMIVKNTLDSDLSANDVYRFGEMFVGSPARLSITLISTTMDKISWLLTQLTTDAAGATGARKILPSLLAMIDATILRVGKLDGDDGLLASRVRLVDSISKSLSAIERSLQDAEAAPTSLDENENTGRLLLATASCISLIIGAKLPVSPNTGAPKPDVLSLCRAYLKVLISLPRQVVHDNGSLRDLLGALLEMIPGPLRASARSLLLADFASPDTRAAVEAVPQLGEVLPFVAPEQTQMGVDIQGSAETQPTVQPLDARPWEMFDRLTPVPYINKRAQRFLARQPFIDAASIPVSLFGPVISRDAVGDASFSNDDLDDIGTDGEDTEQPLANSYLNFISERNLGNGMAGEPSSAKEITTSAYAGPPGLDNAFVKSSSISPQVPLEPLQSPAVDETPLPPRRRSSSRLAQKGSESNADHAMLGEEGDSSTASSEDEKTAENKGTEASEKGEDVDADAPPAKKARRGSKASVRSTTGGKAPAKSLGRPTVGGKNVGRKSVSGKAPRKGKK